MGHKTHPYGFRLGIIKDWKAHWYAQNGGSYRNLLNQDLRIRESIKDEYKNFSDAGIAKVEIDRGAQDSVVNIHSARPGRRYTGRAAEVSALSAGGAGPD